MRPEVIAGSDCELRVATSSVETREPWVAVGKVAGFSDAKQQRCPLPQRIGKTGNWISSRGWGWGQQG